jgi:hypothetical protein
MLKGNRGLPGHKCKFREDLVKRFIKWIESYELGVHGEPYDFKQKYDKKFFESEPKTIGLRIKKN